MYVCKTRKKVYGHGFCFESCVYVCLSVPWNAAERFFATSNKINSRETQHSEHNGVMLWVLCLSAVYFINTIPCTVFCRRTDKTRYYKYGIVTYDYILNEAYCRLRFAWYPLIPYYIYYKQSEALLYILRCMCVRLEKRSMGMVFVFNLVCLCVCLCLSREMQQRDFLQPTTK